MAPTAIVTGAGSGIGRAVALAFLAEGYQVVLAGRREGRLVETLRAAGNSGRSAVAVPTDVRDANAVKALFERTQSHFGRVDVLFNNAGASAPAVALEELSLEQWRTVVDTNLTGAFLCIQAAFRAMKAQAPKGGRIINNGSIASVSPRPNTMPYTATKHAVTGLTRQAALDGRDHDIACGQIDVGNADTELTQPMQQGILQPSGQVQREPVIEAEEVARAVLYMASLPLEANVLSMTVMATKMPFVGRG